jgi:ElaB/YqjD/DUF883 family membrane-anchored ribosome-binding protein
MPDLREDARHYSRPAPPDGGAIPLYPAFISGETTKEDQAMWGQKQELSGDGMLAVGSQKASEAMEMLRSGIDQATRAMRELTDASGDLVQRAGGMAKDLRKQSERAASTLSHQVEQNPLTSLAIAFAVGFMFASLIRR